MPQTSRMPRWYTIPVRVLLVTYIGTLISFAVSLLLGIIVTVAVSFLRHVHPNLTVAYLRIAIPSALVAGGIFFVLALFMKIRHYRRSKTLAAIERMI